MSVDLTEPILDCESGNDLPDTFDAKQWALANRLAGPLLARWGVVGLVATDSGALYYAIDQIAELTRSAEMKQAEAQLTELAASLPREWSEGFASGKKQHPVDLAHNAHQWRVDAAFLLGVAIGLRAQAALTGGER